MPSPYETYAKDYLKLSDHMKLLIIKWKTILASRYKGWGIRCPNTSEPTTKSQRVTPKIPNSLTSRSQLVQDSIYQSNGSNDLMTAISPLLSS
jgi:hypothetical protein